MININLQTKCKTNKWKVYDFRTAPGSLTLFSLSNYRSKAVWWRCIHIRKCNKRFYEVLFEFKYRFCIGKNQASWKIFYWNRLILFSALDKTICGQRIRNKYGSNQCDPLWNALPGKQCLLNIERNWITIISTNVKYFLHANVDKIMNKCYIDEQPLLIISKVHYKNFDWNIN